MAKVVVGKASEIGPGQMAHVTAGGKEVLVANIGGVFYAAGNTCNHAGAELHEGTLDGKELTCPWHGAKWDVTTGEMIWFPQKLKPIGSYKVSVENGTVYVEV
ncbi:Rieske (2Fe-2S) protein [Nitrososphaera viennensis]|uniref:Rieske 2Fe-2S domain-containing protein n=2 Tax=Nitrososphaera viennensis TaxID=1034015 RepID=A0A977IDT3_9ARCH|nr:Rieske 2Fe-2S domain-containing protein [Nitrososphaera viennensis]AIC17291.1 putative rieske (2Fe-2S) domain protein [Nitrososphaera viennensis EN76]UVS69174.1 Rieske 2Fe-2S domain-containing protein [Nitrososphaera viennensis]